MEQVDVGAHVAALCAQALEKSLKGYLFLNGVTPGMDHRPDKYLPLLLSGALVRFETHVRHLAALFDVSTRGAIRELFDLTPGGLGHRSDVPNTEYPWRDEDEWRHTPCGHPRFAGTQTVDAWLKTATRVSSRLRRLGIAAERENR
jgi:hypothetical protein